MYKNLINLINDDKKKINAQTELFAPLALIIIILIFLLPMFLLIEGINVDDAAFASFPKLTAVARAYQNGEIPFWDPHEFCGGKPFYIMLENPAYNIFHIPFFYLADLDNIDQSFYVLYIIPFALMVLFAGLGAYLFARYYFKFNYLLSILMGFLWAVNPSMGNSVLSTMDTTVFACMPWIAFAMSQFFETKKWYWWTAGVFSFALLNTSYTVNYPVRIYFTFACIFLILAVWYIIKDLKNILTALLAVLIPVTAFFMTAFVWTHILESAKYSTEQVKLSYSEIVNFIPNSVPPGHLLTLFIPNFNGSLNNIHAWGDGLLIHSADRNLTGGVFTTFCILISIIVLYNNKDWKININGKYKIWLIISLTINILMLSVMMARYTPVYFIMCKLIPWIFLIPHPFYFHFAHHFAAIISVILGIEFFIEYIQNSNDLLNKFKSRTAIYYTGFIAVFIIIYLFAPVPTYGSQAYKFLFKFKEWKWFLTNPILYFIIASTVLIVTYSKKKKNFSLFKYTLITAVFLEAFFIGYLTFYRNMVMPRPLEKNRHENMQRRHFTLPGKNPFYSGIKELKKLAEKSEYRWASDLAITDTMSWMINGRTLAGYDSKPLITNIRKILDSFYVNFPYQIVTFGFPKQLLSNMNVGHIVAYNNLLEENTLYSYNIDDIDYYFIRKKEFLENLNEELYDFYFRNFNGPAFKIYDIEKPLPYIYFQNKIFNADSNVQKELLFKEDLRKFAMIRLLDGNSSYQTGGDILNINDLKNFKVNTANQFDELQEKNKIIDINKKYYNSLKLNVEISEPVLMVRNEAFHPDWKIFVNGKREKLVQVNFFQQGILLKPGKYEIIYKFFPERLKTGFYISLFVLIINILIAAFFMSKKMLKK